jgi:hypothetical protein
MKIKTSLALISLTVAANLIAAQSSSAQESRGARFSFAPNQWKVERNKMPSDYNSPAHNRNGSVPKNANFLGVDPQMLAKPPVPVVQQQVAARPIINTVAPQISTPQAQASFNPAFGRPQMASLPHVAIPNIQPAQAQSKAISPIAHKPIFPASKAKHLRTNTNVNGKLLKRHTSPAIAERATPAIANYGKNFGYVPGPYLPTTSTSGANARAEVRGRLLHK